MRSYWEQSFLNEIFDIVIIGAGFTGLFSALELKKKYPGYSILVVDRSYPPKGASTRNAGFACFGSPTEIIDDLDSEAPDKVFERVENRYRGISAIRTLFDAGTIEYEQNGGYELISQIGKISGKAFKNEIHRINVGLKEVFKDVVFRKIDNRFGFADTKEVYFTPFEGQLNPFKLWNSLYQLALSSGIQVYFTEITGFNEGDPVELMTGQGIIRGFKSIFCTNAFTGSFFEESIEPGRGQVLITSPVRDLQLKGNFHMDRGYVYFRNVGNRVLIGGGRNLDYEAEKTDLFETSAPVQEYLENLLSRIILPNAAFSIEHRWSGIMAFGRNNEKEFILKQKNRNILIAARHGGMGVAMAPIVGQKIAQLI